MLPTSSFLDLYLPYLKRGRPMKDKFRNNIRKIAWVIISLIVALLLNITYRQTVQAEFLLGHPLNLRAVETANRIERGQILDRHGEKLAYSNLERKGTYQRIYPGEEVFAHITGYDSPKYGKTGIESAYNGYLSGLADPYRQLGPISRLVGRQHGHNVTLTIDSKIQESAYLAMGSHRGAVVVISPKTGAILAMVSKPSFDPNLIDADWTAISQSKDSFLLNRALQGLYPPGSIIKTIIAEAALSENIVTPEKIFNCEGVLKVGNYSLPEVGLKAHGEVDIQEALTVSCNVAFGQLALLLGHSKIEKTFTRYGFNRQSNSKLEESPGVIPDTGKLSPGEIAQLGIGQGPLLVTPLKMALLASAFANHGMIMEPYIVDKVIDPNGIVSMQHRPVKWLTPTTPELAEKVKQMMISVVSKGSGQAAYIKGVQVAGKTGTAENPHGRPHAWFIGFAPAENPQVAIAVIVENAGSGGGVAAPIAREIFLKALGR